MKAIKIEITFNLQEKDANSEEFKAFVKEMKSGEFEKDLESNRLNAKDVKLTLTQK